MPKKFRPLGPMTGVGELIFGERERGRKKQEAVAMLLLLLLLPACALANDPLLLFAQSSVFQFTVGTSMPIVMSKKGGLAATLGYQFNYVLPSNLSQLESVQIIHARSLDTSQLLDLSGVYRSLEDLLHRYGWGDARHCMLRTICELAEAPLQRAGHHVVEEIIHLLLTPSEDGDEVSNPYLEAELLGRRGGRGECARAYNGCRGSPLDSFTELG